VIELQVELILWGARRGGLPRAVNNGLRPSFSYAEELVACEVWIDNCTGLVPLDTALMGRIRLPYANELGWHFQGGERFRLNIASQVIGEGSVLRML
jgi:hypothetical protein